jgi:hypothetical protein
LEGDHNGAFGGFVKYDDVDDGGGDDIDLLTREQLFARAVCCWAGPVAEWHDQRHRRDAVDEEAYMDTHGKGDFERVQDLCNKIACCDLGIAEPERGCAWPSAVRELGPDLAGDAADAAQALVEEHWPKIRKLALALQERGKLTRAEIGELLT